MTLARQKRFARCALALFVLGCLGWLLQLDTAKKISTDVLELLPEAENAPEIAIVRNVANDVQARAMLFALRDPSGATPVESLAAPFARALLDSGHFAEAVSSTDPSVRDALGRAIFERRFSLLLPTWLAENEREFVSTGLPPSEFASWTAERAAARLEGFLARPEALPMENLIVNDPLLLVPGLAAKWSDFAGAPTEKPEFALVWARIKASPLSDEGQAPVFTAIESAMGVVRQSHPAVELRWTGVNRFASASRARIQEEITLLNSVSLAAVLLVAFAFVRRPWQVVHLVPVILISLLGAWTVSTLVFERVHVLVFVIGALLTGVAIDYGFYISMQPPLYPAEPYAAKLRRLAKPLLVSCFTTVIGFSLLVFSELPLLRQIGVFVGAGLLSALAAAMLYFAQLERPLIATRELPLLNRGRFSSRLLPLGLLLAAAAIALSTPWRAHWRDDIRDLEIASPELRANDAALRQLFGETADRAAYLTHGATLAEARDHLENFIEQRRRDSPEDDALSLGTLFPTESDWQTAPARLQRLDTFSRHFREALDERGFDTASFERFFAAWDEYRQAPPPSGDYPSLYREITPHLRGPLGQLMRTEGAMPWFITLAPNRSTPNAASAANTIAVNQLESLNTLFSRYRWTALRLSLIGLGFVIASVFAVYRGAHGIRIALIPIGACFFVLGLFSMIGRPLNFFHLLGAFLGVCLSHNYAIFSDATQRSRTLPPTAIRLSAFTTAASFGVLGFSQIPVIHALGATVAAIVLTTLIAIEIEARTPVRP